MQGVVPAAGRGTRLRPMTDDRPKGLVSVAGRPLLAHCFEALSNVGVEELIVVIGYRGEQIRDRFGRAYDGLPIRYVEQTTPVGLADAVRRVRSVVEGDFVLLNGDNVVDANLGAVVDRHRTVGADATLLIEQVSPEQAETGGVVVFDGDRVTGVVEKPDEPPSMWVGRGFYAFSPAIFSACELLRPSPTGEYELSAAVDLLLRAGATVEAVPLAGSCINVNTPADIEEAEQLIAT